MTALPQGSSVLLWLAIVVLASAGQLSFKAAANGSEAGGALSGWLRMLARPWLWLGIGCFVLQFVLWIAFLARVALSRGMLLAALEIVVVYVAGRVLFKEPGSWLRVAGVVLISVGVAIVAVAP